MERRGGGVLGRSEFACGARWALRVPAAIAVTLNESKPVRSWILVP